MAKTHSPLVGYNTNVRHRGKVYHIQTEDSGVRHPHVVTHLFADGGRIVASRKTSYAEYLGREDLRDIVKRLMREQHKAMFVALRQGVYDEDAGEPEATAADTMVGDVAPSQATPTEGGTVDVEALERAAAQLAQDSPAASEPPAASAEPAAASASVRSPLFGDAMLDDKSLDEVILGYLAEDLEPEDG